MKNTYLNQFKLYKKDILKKKQLLYISFVTKKCWLNVLPVNNTYLNQFKLSKKDIIKKQLLYKYFLALKSWQ